MLELAQRSPVMQSAARAAHALAMLARRDTNVVVAAVALNNVLRALSSVILTRLLMPEAFGISGIIASIQFTLAMVSDLGFQAFVVRHDDGDKRQFLDTVWTISLIRSLVLTLLLVALASPIAHLLGKPELAPVIAISALVFMIEGAASLTLITAIRKSMIIRLSLIELLVLLFQIAATAVLAYFWRNYWAILVGLLASSALKTLLSYTMFSDSARKLALDRRYARELYRFARFVTGSSIITLLLLQCDKLVFARLMTLEHFGLYMLAVNLASAPLAFATAYASRVLYPAYSQRWRAGGRNPRQEFYVKRRLPSILYTFAAGGLIGSAPLVIAVLYDHRYAEAATYLQILAIGSFFALASTSSNEVLTATGRVSATFEASVAKLAWLALAGPVGYMTGGEIGLIWALGLMEAPAVLFKWVRMARANLLDLRQEFLFLAAGVIGILTGAAGTAISRPYL